MAKTLVPKKKLLKKAAPVQIAKKAVAVQPLKKAVKPAKPLQSKVQPKKSVLATARPAAAPARPAQKPAQLPKAVRPAIKPVTKAMPKVAPKIAQVATKPAKPKKIFKNFFVKIFSRHPSIAPLRKAMLTPMNVLYRHGSTTDPVLKKYDVEINTAEAIRNSASKLRMKNKFQEAGVKTAVWYTYNGNNFMNGNAVVEGPIEFPIVAKHIHGSRGRGNYLLNTEAEFNEWRQGKVFANYIFEKFYNYNREYRLHVTEAGCFYTCRKMLKSDTPEKDRWFRNDSNSVWIIESNPDFDKPTNWKVIEEECIKAVKATGLDVGACDVRVQSAKTGKGKDREAPDFIVLEVNSAPSMGEITLEKYREELPKIAARKFAKNK